MKRNAVFALSLLFVFSSFGCDKGGDDDEGSSGVNAYEQRYGDTPPIDCAVYDTRINECTEEFMAAYQTTEQCIQAGQGDGAQGVEYYRMGLSMMEQLCQEQYAHRDPHWHARYNTCNEMTDCAEWGPCAANAVGNPIGPPEL